MQHSCGVTYSIALSYQFQNTTILVNLYSLFIGLTHRVYIHQCPNPITVYKRPINSLELC